MGRRFGNHIVFFSQINEEELIWRWNVLGVSPTERELLDAHPTHVKIKGTWYEVYRPSQLRDMRGEDGYYRYLYIEVNHKNGHYYIGKSNKQRWSEVRSYKGSGVRFCNEYEKYKEYFRMYVFKVCKTAEETEDLEAYIVDDELLNDPCCINIKHGGAGTGDHGTDEEKLEARRKRGREFALAHPEIGRKLVADAKAYYKAHPEELKRRSASIKAAMSGEEYKAMTRDRIKAWRERDPDSYAKGLEKSKLANRDPAVRAKKRESLAKWKKEHPEEAAEWDKKLEASRQTPEAKAKRKASIRRWMEEHPEEAAANAKKRALASAAKYAKPTERIDLITGKVLQTFNSIKSAADWVFAQGLTKSNNAASSISGVCLRKSSVGHGIRKSAFGYGWRYANSEDASANSTQLYLNLGL